METQEVIKRLEKELGIEFSESKNLSYWNNENISVRFVGNYLLRYVYAEIKGVVETTYWINNLEQATDETIDEFISKIKSHLPKVGDIKEENIYTTLDEIKECQKEINILLNRIEKEMK